MSGAHRRLPSVAFRRGRLSDVAALVALEQAVFTTDILSRRSFRHFLTSRRASLLVAQAQDSLAGYVLVLYPPRSTLARLYSIAVAPHIGRRGVGPLLLAAAEEAARRRGRRAMRLEVHEHNTRAIARYEKSGYRLFGRHPDYYDDRADALRFEKPLRSQLAAPPWTIPQWRLAPAAESALMVDIAARVVANHCFSLYDNLCLARPRAHDRPASAQPVSALLISTGRGPAHDRLGHPRRPASRSA